MNVVPMFPLMFSGKVALEKQGDAAAQPAAKAMEPCDAAIEKITEEKPIQSGSGK